MKKESKIHINFFGNQILKAMIELSKGTYVYERDGDVYMSIPLPDIPNMKIQLCKRLEKLCKNVIKIENQ